MRSKFAVMAAATLASATVAMAQPPSGPVYVTGAGPFNEGYAPGAIAGRQLLDNGTAGDATAGDGIYTRDITTTPSLGPGRSQWKASTAGFSYEVPGSFLTAVAEVPTTGAVVKYLIDVNQRNDGFRPNANQFGAKGVAYSIPSPYTTTSTLRAAGSWQNELGGPSDFNVTDTASILLDNGLNGDAVAGDSTYTLVLTGLPVNNYAFVVTKNGSYDYAIKDIGWTDGGGGDIPFTVLAPTDNIKIEVDSIRGRWKVTNDNPTLNPGPPFYALSNSWNTTLSSATVLYDNGLGGDVTANDGIYSRRFASTTTGTSTVKVAQGVGPQYPLSGTVTSTEGTPFVTATIGQFVLVQFDTNVRADGFVPNTRYVWTDPASRLTFNPTGTSGNWVQAVGNWMTDVNLTSDWNDNDTFAQLRDDATVGDATAGDGVFARSFANPSGVPANDEFKIIAGEAPNRYQIQIGAPSEGLTRNGNPANQIIPAAIPGGTPVVFRADTVTGRSSLNSAGLPTRPATLNALPGTGAGVTDAFMY